MNTLEKVKSDLQEIRNLNKRNIYNTKSKEYSKLFKKLPTLESKVMIDCYINGTSQKSCGLEMSYCERQIRRIVQKSISLIVKMLDKREL